MGEYGRPPEQNRFNMRSFSEKNEVPLKIWEKYLFKDKSKRRIIGEGVGAKSLLSSWFMFLMLSLILEVKMVIY